MQSNAVKVTFWPSNSHFWGQNSLNIVKVRYCKSSMASGAPPQTPFLNIYEYCLNWKLVLKKGWKSCTHYVKKKKKWSWYGKPSLINNSNFYMNNFKSTKHLKKKWNTQLKWTKWAFKSTKNWIKRNIFWKLNQRTFGYIKILISYHIFSTEILFYEKISRTEWWTNKKIITTQSRTPGGLHEWLGKKVSFIFLALVSSICFLGFGWGHDRFALRLMMFT